MTAGSMPEGSFVLRTNTGEWLEWNLFGADGGRYWPDISAARECAKSFTKIHANVRVHLYEVRDAFPSWVETWKYGVSVGPIERPKALRAAAKILPREATTSA